MLPFINKGVLLLTLFCKFFSFIAHFTKQDLKLCNRVVWCENVKEIIRTIGNIHIIDVFDNVFGNNHETDFKQVIIIMHLPPRIMDAWGDLRAHQNLCSKLTMIKLGKMEKLEKIPPLKLQVKSPCPSTYAGKKS